uniref:Uncharacterized protein n=1 Tax=Cannabis sativa TaxID=3483 RepID=A0A803PCP7_CANSA
MCVVEVVSRGARREPRGLACEPLCCSCVLWRLRAVVRGESLEGSHASPCGACMRFVVLLVCVFGGCKCKVRGECISTKWHWRRNQRTGRARKKRATTPSEDSESEEVRVAVTMNLQGYHTPATGHHRTPDKGTRWRATSSTCGMHHESDALSPWDHFVLHAIRAYKYSFSDVREG